MMTTSTDDGGLRLTTITASYHFNRDSEYNERHHGLGLGYKWQNGIVAGVSKYTNSYNDPSNLVQIGQEVGSNGKYWGWMAGVADGYIDRDENDKEEFSGIAGITLRYHILQFLITPGGGAFGLTIPLQ